MENKKYLTKEEKELAVVKQVWEERENCIRYLNSQQSYSKWKSNANFYNGKQWATANEKTKNFPRVVNNIIKKIVDQKVANISGSNTSIRFHIPNDEVKSTRLTKFYEFMSRDLELRDNDEIALLYGAIYGTYFTHFFWNAKALTEHGLEGKLEMEILEPEKVFVENCRIHDIQKQKYIIIENQLNVENVIELARRLNGGKFKREDEIKSDSEDNLYLDSGTQEKCTVLCKYFRIGGVVHYQYFTRKLILCDPIPIDPRMNIKRKFNVEDIDSSIDGLASKGFNSNFTSTFKATLYPICYGVWDYNIKSFFGLSEVNDLIEIQKTINKELSIKTYNSQVQANPTILVKQNALQDQEITDDHGQILVDYSTNASWGYSYLVPQISNTGLDNALTMLDLARDTHNAGDLISGDSINRDVSGVAISQLQAQANKPIEKQRRLFWKFKREEAKVLLQFFILYFYEKENAKDYYYTLGKTESDRLRSYVNAIDTNITYEDLGFQEDGTTNDTFYGKEYESADFGIQVEIGIGTQYSEIVGVDLANQMFLSGSVKNMSVEELDAYMEMLPTNYANLEHLKAFNARRGKTQIDQLNQMVQEQQAQLEQMNAMLQEALQNNDALKKEYSSKINTLKSAYDTVQREAYKAVMSSRQNNTTSKVDNEKLSPKE